MYVYFLKILKLIYLVSSWIQKQDCFVSNKSGEKSSPTMFMFFVNVI